MHLHKAHTKCGNKGQTNEKSNAYSETAVARESATINSISQRLKGRERSIGCIMGNETEALDMP